MNCSPSSSLNGFIQEHVYIDKPPRLGHLKVFSYLPYIHVPKDKCRKLGLELSEVFLLGMMMLQKLIRSIVHNCKKLLSQRMLSTMNQLWEHPTSRRKELIKYCKKGLVVLLLEDLEDEYLMSQGGGLKKVIDANDDQHEANGPLLHPQECSSSEEIDTLQTSFSSSKQVNNSQDNS
jgi:hypothetical protein